MFRIDGALPVTHLFALYFFKCFLITRRLVCGRWSPGAIVADLAGDIWFFPMNLGT